jgi:hypothetical protein
MDRFVYVNSFGLIGPLNRICRFLVVGWLQGNICQFVVSMNLQFVGFVGSLNDTYVRMSRAFPKPDERWLDLKFHYNIEYVIMLCYSTRVASTCSTRVVLEYAVILISQRSFRAVIAMFHRDYHPYELKFLL